MKKNHFAGLVVSLILILTGGLMAQDTGEPVEGEGGRARGAKLRAARLRAGGAAKKQRLFDQLGITVVKGEEGPMADTDGDGVGDVPLHDYLESMADVLIDTDDDGEGDTALQDLLDRAKKAMRKLKRRGGQGPRPAPEPPAEG